MGYPYNDNNNCNVGCDCDEPVVNDTQSMSMLEKVCYLINKVSEFAGSLSQYDDRIDAKEDSVLITNNRKLSPSGNFTGTWFGDNYLNIKSEIENNENQIDYISQQFSDGQTGLVIDGGFFDETGIRKNYDGGRF